MSAYEVSLVLGLTRNAYSHYENGRRLPSLTVFLKICTLFNVSADYLLGITDAP